MVKILFCDRCKKEIKRYDDKDLFSDFGSNSSLWENINDASITPNMEIVRIIKPQLCKLCRLEFNVLMRNFNKEINSFLESKTQVDIETKEKKKQKKEQKKFGFFS